ncbi:unnamed protein product, partial [Brassica rapa subsp. trilocularis]
MGFVCHVEHPHKFISNYLATFETPPELLGKKLGTWAQDLYNEIYGPPIYEDQVEEGGNEDLVLNNIDEVGLHVVEQLEQTKDVPIIKADEVD